MLQEEGAQQISQKIEVEFYNEPKRRRTQRIRINNNVNDLDLALLEVTDIPDDIQPLQISSEIVRSGRPIRVIGHSSIASKDWLQLSGEINGADSKQLVFSPLALSQGNSGSPVLDEDHQVVGIVYESRSPSEPGDTAGIGFAYPASLIREQLRIWGIESN